MSESAMSPHVPNGDGQGQRVAPGGDKSLFPNERAAFRPSRATPRIGIKQWLYQWTPDLKAIGNRILRAERVERALKDGASTTGPEIDGDPDQDGKLFGKILRDQDRRRFDIDWLDHYEAEYGRDAMLEILSALNERFGCQPAVPIPDPQRDAEDLLAIKREIRARREWDSKLEAKIDRLIEVRR